ncbi:MAG: hypothetical protein JW746_08485 [Candidatus Krumholzibacteriota bacterium]|nr:hypothetical protein [Candidatus Krumholzibacteriota bacterium]
MRRLLYYVISASISLSVILSAGCDGVFTGSEAGNQRPEMWMSSGPVEGSLTGYQVHFYWSGWDPDGEISHFEICIVDGAEGIGFLEADTTGADKWFRTTVHDTIFRVMANENPQPYDSNDVNSVYTKYDLAHTVFMRAVDRQGLESEVVFRSFTAWTISPYVDITHPPDGTYAYSTVITFRWVGVDPIDSRSNTQDPDLVRYFSYQLPDFLPDSFSIYRDLNEHPLAYEDEWSPWIPYSTDVNAPGRTVKVGVNETLALNKEHIFAVQAKDEAGAVTAIFKKDLNVKKFVVSWKQGPLLTVRETYLGGAKFIGTTMNPTVHKLPPGIPLNFCWEATAFDYGGEIVGYRYGWDIQDLNDPSQWVGGGAYSPFTLCAREKRLYTGIHTFFIEAIDDGGRITRGKVEIEVIQFTMERNLLWVDDLPSDENPVLLITRTMPQESEHDEFWTNICSRAADFLPDRDIYDTTDHNFEPPDIEVIGKYANIIWTFSSSSAADKPLAWKKIVRYIPESKVGFAGEIELNYISIFMTKGGHVLTCGINNRGGGGFFDTFYTPPLLPALFKDDIYEYASEDTTGVNSMPYKDYCVTALDKVDAAWHTGTDWPEGIKRVVNDDGFVRALRDPYDPIVLEHLTGFPDTLALWSGVTCPSCFFNPQLRGFTYVEIFDSRYWLDFKQITNSQNCFHSTYRMRTRNNLSPINIQTVALVVTKFKDEFEGMEEINFIPAYSFHFGLPLWFFDRNDVNQIMDVIFTEWQIIASE